MSPMLAMQRQSEAETTQPTPVSSRSFSEWLDDVASGECDWQMMFRGVLPTVNANADAGWELLALVDQHYRLHRISEEDFYGLNSSLQTVLLGVPPAAKGPAGRGPSPKVASVGVAPAAAAATSPAAPAPKGDVAPESTPSAFPEVTAQMPAADSSSPTEKVIAAAARAAEPPPLRKPAPPDTRTAGASREPFLKSVPGPGPAARTRTLVINEVLRNRYRIRGVLGHGGMGTVYAAIDEYRLDQADGGQRVAIKVLHTEVIKRPKLLAELRSEFQRLQSLSHPNIVRVHEFDRDDDLTFFTMEQLSGAPLSRVIANHASGPLHRAHAMSIIRQVGGAVAYAHSRGIVHGDLNPGNIFITDQGEVRVLDFGASYRLYREPTIPDVEELSRTAVATPSYSSCEVLQGGPANVRDDIYAMACVSYTLLAGKHPFQGRNALQARAAHLSPRRPGGLSSRQWRALRAGLRFEREHRPNDMLEWLDQLSVEADSRPLPNLTVIMSPGAARRSSVGWVSLGLIALLAAVGWWALENPDAVVRSSADLKGAAQKLWSDVQGTGAAETAAAPIPDQPAADTAAPTPARPPPPPVTRPAPGGAKSGAASGTTATQTIAENAGPSGAAAGTATAAPRARIEMAADEVEVTPMNSVAAVVVRRRESYRNNVSFTWWTEAGTAKPGKDFVPVSARTEYMLAGEREAQLLIPVVADPRRHESRSFYVVIDQPSEGARLGSRTLTMVTIPPSE